MKTKNLKNSNLYFALVLLLSVLVICLNSIETKAQQVTYSISGNATGAQVVPAVTGNGTGSITGTYNPSTKVLDYTTSWNNLTGMPTTAGFYNGATGVSGKAFGDPWSLGTNNKPTGNITSKITLTEAQEKDLLAGNWYYSYGTDTNANGEIRGQITANKQ